MANIESIKDYYNQYDPTKGYARNLYIAGKVIQSNEMNEMESQLLNRIRNVGDTVLTNGDIIEGCQLVIGESSATVTAGKVYLDGDVRNIPPTTVDLTFRGQERIGVKLISEIVTPADDPEILDPATGHDNFGAEGAYRLKEYVRVTVNDDTANTVFILNDGIQEKVKIAEDVSQLDKINATLAKRTFDESGNYKVTGLELADKNMSDEDNIYISVEPGRAYVKGYEVVKDTAVNIPVPRPKTIRTAINEPKLYQSGTDKYVLNYNYISRIVRIVSIVSSTQMITRGSIAGGIDYLPLYPVVGITSIKQGSDIYVQGTDFRLTKDGVDWSLSGNEPNPGESYEVTWTYNKTMKKGIDYELEMDADDDRGYVKFLGKDVPVDGSTFLCDYEYRLCRVDVFSLDDSGKILRTEGQPDILRTLGTPSVSDDAVLVLGSVMVLPNTSKISVKNNNTKNISMLELYNVLERLTELEYNQAMTDLDQEAADGEPATQLKGVFTDGFIGLTKADVHHPDWSASIDLDNALLTVPYTPTISGLSVDQAMKPVAGQFSRLLTAPFSIQNVLSQTLATGIIRVNAYNAFPKNPVPKLSPESDNWVDEKTVTVQGETQVKTVTIRRWWYHLTASWAQEEKALMISYGFADGGQSLGWNSGSATTQKTVVSSILDNAILYMRQIPIDVSVSCMEPNVDNVEGKFDGRVVPLVPKSDRYKGTNPGTLKADVNGNTYGHFVIPEGTMCGTREFQVYAQTTPSLIGTAKFSAEGRQRVTTKTVFTQKVVINPTDPVAQSFQFPSDMYITGVGIFFKDKDQREPITVQLRNMVNGYPGTTVYAEKVLQGNEIRTGMIANQETVVTFDDPAYVSGGQQYCFTILSDSDIDSLWMAETTKQDVATGATVAKNPYLAGMMFSSSNAITWTAHQNADLKFNLYGAKFNGNGEVVFEEVNGIEADSILVMSEEAIPAGCSVDWQYSADKSGEWLPITTYSERALETQAEAVRLKTTLKSNGYTSPAIALDSLILASMTNSTQGVYVSKNVNVPEGFDTVKVVADIEMPAGSNVEVYYATDTNGNDWNALSTSDTLQLSQTVTQCTFEQALGATKNNYRVKVVLTTTDPLNPPKVRNLRSIMKTV